MVNWERERKQMRILQVTPYFNEHYGGTERYCYNLSLALAELGHEVHVYSARIKNSSLRKEERDGISIHRFPTACTIWNINPLSIMLHRLISSDFDIIHVHSYLYTSSNQAVLAKILRAAIRRRTSIILHLHGGLGIPPYLKHQAIKKIAKQVYDATLGKIMMRSADHILSACQSDAILAQKYFNIPSSKISVIYNAVDTTVFTPIKNRMGTTQNPYLLYVGDLERWKGPRAILKAMEILKKRGHDFLLKLAGVGSIEKQLRKMTDGLDIKFLGVVPHSQIPKLMREAFACILPSYWEGIPTVGMEAMASGTPFIGTDVGGIPELINPDVTGILVPPNAPLEIANAVQRLENDKLRQKIIREAIKLINEKFTIEIIAKQTEKVYMKIIR
jgi:glycosyltransferase involved in cell wall biosynthesis